MSLSFHPPQPPPRPDNRDAVLLQAFQRQPDSETVNLLYKQLDHRDVDTLTRFLQEFPRKTHLILSQNRFGPLGAQALADSAVLSANEDGAGLRQLEIVADSIRDAGAISIGACLAASRLTRLVLSFAMIGNDGAAGLARALQDPSCQLQELMLHHNNITDVVAVGEALRVNRVLRRLDLSHNNMVSLPPVLTQALADPDCPLVWLDLSNNTGLDAPSIDALGTALRTNSALKTLYLHGMAIADATMLARGLEHNTTLQRCNLSSCRLGVNGATVLGSTLSINTGLVELNLHLNSIGPDGAEALAQGLIGNTALRRLDLTRNDIGDGGAMALAAVLEPRHHHHQQQQQQHNSNRTLRALNLNRNKVGNAGATALAKALVQRHWQNQHDMNSTDGINSDNTGLTTLHLAKNNISLPGGDALLMAVRLNHAVQELSLSDNRLRNDSVYPSLVFYLAWNRRKYWRLLKDCDRLPLGVWPMVLSRMLSTEEDRRFAYHFLSSRPEVLLVVQK